LSEGRTLQLECNFFGLTDNYQILLHKQLFDLVYYGRLSHDDAYSMPVQFRSFFYQQLSNAKEAEAEASKDKGDGISSGEGVPQPKYGPPKDIQGMIVGMKKKP